MLVEGTDHRDRDLDSNPDSLTYCMILEELHPAGMSSKFAEYHIFLL